MYLAISSGVTSTSADAGPLAGSIFGGVTRGVVDREMEGGRSGVSALFCLEAGSEATLSVSVVGLRPNLLLHDDGSDDAIMILRSDST